MTNGKVIVRGYSDLFANSTPVSVVWDDIERGPIGKSRVLSFEIAHDGYVSFRSGWRRTKVAVFAGRTNDIQLELNAVFGLKATELVTDVQRFQQAVAESKTNRHSESGGEPAQPPKLNCPHCGGLQTVTRSTVKLSTRPSISKVATGFLTMGNSLIFTGVHKKQSTNELSCSACDMVWHVG